MARVVLPAEPLTDAPTALRPWRDSDLTALVAACQDPAIARWTRVPSPYGESDGRAYLLARYEAILDGRSAPFAIVDAATGALLGSIAVMRICWEHERGEVGYWLAAEGRGQGHATRAVRLICGFSFLTLGLKRLQLVAATGNEPSQRVAERCGFRLEATLRRYISNQGRRHDTFAYGLLAEHAAD